MADDPDAAHDVSLTVRAPASAADLDAVRALCWSYRDFLLTMPQEDARIAETFYPAGRYRALLDRLAEDHAPPGGTIRLVEKGGVPAGCGMFHTFAPGDAEIKRVFVAPEARGTGAGRALMSALIDAARAAGFRRVLMDTAKPLTRARDLYLGLGFRLRGPYYEVPEIARGRLLFFELPL